MSTSRSPKSKQLMKAVAIDRFGPPAVLKLRRLPELANSSMQKAASTHSALPWILIT